MTIIRTLDGDPCFHPLDVVAEVAEAHDWTVEWVSENELAVSAAGRWCGHQVYLLWEDDPMSLHCVLAFETVVEEARRADVNELVALINGRLWMGHFAFWHDAGVVAYRHTLPFRGADALSVEQAEDVLCTAFEEGDRFYPAFHIVVCDGQSARDALAAAMVETAGEA